jgi:hypothetical protein
MQTIRRLFGFGKKPEVNIPDEEAAASITSVIEDGAPLPFNQVSGSNRMFEKPVPTEDKLAVFQRLVGIDSSQLLIPSGARRPAMNLGLYARIVRSQVQGRRYYKVYSLIINCCLGIQLVVAATLTALGASQGSASAVAGLGAINTIIAGFLTYLKGSGMPNRLRYYESEWRKLREYIEQRERDFQRQYCSLDPVEEARIVEEMYNRVREDIELNAPDSYNSATRLQKPASGMDSSKAFSISDAARSEKALAEARSSKAFSSGHRQSDLPSKAGHLVSEAMHFRPAQTSGALHTRPNSPSVESREREAADWAYAQSLGASQDFPRPKFPSQPDPALLRSSSLNEPRKSAQSQAARVSSGFWGSSVSQGTSEEVLAKAAKAATEVIRAEAEKAAKGSTKGESSHETGHEAEGSSSFEKKILGLVGLERTHEDSSKDKGPE